MGWDSWILIVVWAMLMTFFSVGIVFARRRAALQGSFTYRGVRYRVAQDRDAEAGLHGEVASLHEIEPLLFSPPFDKESWRNARRGA